MRKFSGRWKQFFDRWVVVDIIIFSASTRMKILPEEINLNWLAHLLQSTDSIFPTGSYAHSFGLEGLVQLGAVKDVKTLADFVTEQIIPAMAYFELPFARLAYKAAIEEDMDRVLLLDGRYDAMKGAREMRLASRRIGSQRFLLLQRLMPGPFVKALAGNQDFYTHATIVIGITGALSGIPLEAVLAASFYQTLAAVIVAALKLLRMGQDAGQTLLFSWLEKTQEAVASSLRIDEADIGWFQPVLDIASARHEMAYTRLFIS